METKNKKNSREKGSYTVEATIVFTFIITVLFAFIFGIMTIHQQVFLQKSINSAVIGAADTMGSLGKEEQELKEVIIHEVNKQLQGSVFSVPDASAMLTITPEEGNLFMAKRIRIEIKQDIKIPLGKIKGFFTGNDYLTIKASTYMLADSTVSSIRNTDLAIEAVTRLTDNEKIQEIIKKLFKLEIAE